MPTLTLSPDARAKVAARLPQAVAPGAASPAPPPPDPETPQPEPPPPPEPPRRTRAAPDPEFYAARAAILAELYRRWPAAFRPAPERRCALKLGIHHDIRAAWPEVDKKMLSAAMNYYAGGNRYLAAVRPGAIRFDLDGNPSGEVSAEHADAAKARWKVNKARQRAAA